MDEFEKEEIKKSRPVVKNKLNEWYDWLVDYVSKPIKNAVSKAFSRAKNSILRLYDGGKKTLRGNVEDEAEKENQENQEEGEKDVDLTPHEHERALKGAYRSFVIAGKPKTDIDSYFDQTKPHIKTLIEEQLKEMESAKIIMTLWVRWKKPVKLAITLDPEDVEDAQDIRGNTSDNYTRVEMPFNSLMTEFFEDSDINDIIQHMLSHIKTQAENPRMPESSFTLHKIMHLNINFHRLPLTRGSSYIELPKWIASKKAVINPNNNNEKCFKWAVIAALYHEEIEKDHQRVSRLKININGTALSFLCQFKR